MMNCDIIFQYAKEQYQTEPEYLWKKFPTCAVLRHQENKKWYTIIMDIPKSKIGLHGEEVVSIINVKCDPLLIGSLRTKHGYFKAYHMNKEHWITILLDDTVPKNEIFALIDESFSLTSSKSKKENSSEK